MEIDSALNPKQPRSFHFTTEDMPLLRLGMSAFGAPLTKTVVLKGESHKFWSSRGEKATK